MLNSLHTDVTLTKVTDYKIISEFSVDGNDVECEAIIVCGSLTVNFAVNGSLGYLELGHKTALKIFSRVAYFVKSVVQARQDIREIDFSGDSIDPSRIKLYRRLAYMVANTYNGTVSEYTPFYSVDFTITL